MFKPESGSYVMSVTPYEDTMLTTRTCMKGSPFKKYDSYEGSCRYYYTGGFFPFALFLSIGIFLTWFGFSFIDKHDPEGTDEWFINIADASICIGIFTCIISFVDLTLC